MSLSFPFGNLEIAYSSNPNFTNATYGDVMLYTGASNQSVLIGVQRGAPAELDVSASNVTVNGALTVTGAVSQPGGFMFRNRVHNGDMHINQRGFSSNLGNVFGGTNHTSYTLDRWKVQMYNDNNAGAGGVVNISQVAVPAPLAGFTNCLQIKVNSNLANTNPVNYERLWVYQYFEGRNMYDLNWGTTNAAPVTVSFYVYSSVTGTYCAILQNSAQDRTYVQNFTITNTNTWQKVSFVVPGCTTGTWATDNTAFASLAISLMAGPGQVGTGGGRTSNLSIWTPELYLYGSTTMNNFVSVNNTMYITGVQLEKGTIATPYEVRPYSMELSLCQRYYVRYGYPVDTTNTTYTLPGTGFCQTTTAGILAFPPPVPMRAMPSGTLSTGANSNWYLYNGNMIVGVSNATISQANLANTNTITINCTSLASTVTVNAPFLLQRANNTNAFLEVAAEM